MMVAVLMYHSISETDGPGSIHPEVFAAQMEHLEATGYAVLPLERVGSWLKEGTELPERTAVLTFDDGLANFYFQAAPVLYSRGWPATVFLPTGYVGGEARWAGAEPTQRDLMTWDQVSELANRGFDFGSHSVSHADLTTLDAGDLRRELYESLEDIKRKLGRKPDCFAPPYGRVNDRVLIEIRRCYGLSVGARLRTVGTDSDAYDIPRIEMHYYRDPRRWRDFLEGRGAGYFMLRRALRTGRSLARSALGLS